jgi:hypothetical protein
VTRYNITEQAHGVAIDLTDVNDREHDLLAAFDECRKGNCSCPTDEYEKVATMDVSASSVAINIRLKAKPGNVFDTTELAACLEHTIEKTNGE